jgi:hypothetical protein
MDVYRRIGRIIGWTVLLFVLFLVPICRFGQPGLLKSFILGYAVSLVNIFFSLISIQWAFSRKIKAFYAVVLGGMALRFLFFAVMAYLVIAVLKWHIGGFLISFIMFYVFLQYHEIRLINSELKGRFSANHDRTDS